MRPWYFITFHTYGTRLHGHHKGSVDRDHNTPGTRFLSEHQARHSSAFSRLKHEPTLLTPLAASVVDRTIREVCAHRGWTIRALNVRSNHVHIVTGAGKSPELAMNSFKSWATRRLVEGGHFQREHRIWSRHGSTRWVTTEESLASAIEYVEKMQGLPFAVSA